MEFDGIVLILAAIAGFFLIITFFQSFVIVSQQHVKIIERIGKFSKVVGPGLNMKLPWLDWVKGSLNLRIQQLDVEVETKTQDNVFIKIIVSVQYFVKEGREYEAFYKLNDPQRQIRSYVFDLVRARVPGIKLDDVFEKKDDIADAVKSELSNEMDDFGYSIQKALVTDIDPDKKVKDSMNEINAAQRIRIAANEKGEAEKILKIKAAEAEAESKRLQGEGIANQRKAIINGLRSSVEEFQSSIKGSTAQDVMNLILMTQYFDTIKEIGANDKSNTIFMPHSPGGLEEVWQQLTKAIAMGNQVQPK